MTRLLRVAPLSSLSLLPPNPRGALPRGPLTARAIALLIAALLVVLAVLAPTADAAAPAPAPIAVSNAWVRATVPGQSGTGAFMTLTAHTPARVIGVASSVAEIVEIHEMSMVGDTARMRQVTVVELPAGQPVEFKPSGYHVMLMDLKRALHAGEKIPLQLRLQSADKKQYTQQIELEVRGLGGDDHSAHKAP